MTPAQRVVICEGYHDRAFWKGWLGRNGCRTQSKDPWGQRVTGGQHGWRTPGGAFVRVLPAGGDLRRVLRFAEVYLRNSETEPVPSMVISTDADGRTVTERMRDVIHNLRALAEPLDLATPQTTGEGLTVGETHIVPLVWPCAPIDPAPGIPSCGTLEQLVCGVLARREPHRAQDIDDFLKTAGDGSGWTRPADVGKSHAWAWMAHRQPVDACERFFEAPWGDDTLAAELEAAMGERAARIMQMLLA